MIANAIFPKQMSTRSFLPISCQLKVIHSIPHNYEVSRRLILIYLFVQCMFFSARLINVIFIFIILRPHILLKIARENMLNTRVITCRPMSAINFGYFLLIPILADTFSNLGYNIEKFHKNGQNKNQVG